MKSQRLCPQCGNELESDMPHGLCAACLMRLGAESLNKPSELGSGEAATIESNFVAPSLDNLKKLLPDFDFIQFIGQGGMGAVYQARQRSLDRIVAIKILAAGASQRDGFSKRFEREAKAMAKLTHANIVAVYDSGRVDDLCYFVMEYIDGANLRAVIRDGRLEPQQALKIVPQICDALQYAHTRGIVHRDIKPENILVDRDGAVKIVDFGLAKLVDVASDDFSLTHSRMVMGTPKYMSPEQIESPMDVDHRADIYSLGVVFYEMLTGELPLGRFSAPSQKVHVDVRLDDVVLRSLEKEPSRRYQQASDIKSDVESVSSTYDSKSNRSEVQEGHQGSWLRRAGCLSILVGLVLLGITIQEMVAAFQSMDEPDRPSSNPLAVEPNQIESDETGDDLELLQRQPWRMVLHYGGPENDDYDQLKVWEFVRDAVVVTHANGSYQAGHISLNASTTPKQLDYSVQAGAPIRGIYDLQPDALRICLETKSVTNRPANFAANEHQVLMVFRPAPDHTSARQLFDKHYLRGAWTVSDFDGSEPPSAVMTQGSRWIFGNSLVVETQGATIQQGKVVLDAEQFPRHLDVQGDESEAPLRHLYQIDKDTLRICMPLRSGLPRPKRFDATEDYAVVKLVRDIDQPDAPNSDTTPWRNDRFNLAATSASPSQQQDQASQTANAQQPTRLDPSVLAERVSKSVQFALIGLPPFGLGVVLVIISYLRKPHHVRAVSQKPVPYRLTPRSTAWMLLAIGIVPAVLGYVGWINDGVQPLYWFVSLPAIVISHVAFAWPHFAHRSRDLGDSTLLLDLKRLGTITIVVAILSAIAFLSNVVATSYHDLRPDRDGGVCSLTRASGVLCILPVLSLFTLQAIGGAELRRRHSYHAAIRGIALLPLTPFFIGLPITVLALWKLCRAEVIESFEHQSKLP